MIFTGFLVKYDDITNTWLHFKNKIPEWNNQLENIAKNMNPILDMESFQGLTARCLKSYLQEIHYSIFISFNELFQELNSRFLLYRDGYYSEIDSNLHTQLNEDKLSELNVFFTRSSPNFMNQHSAIITALNRISDIVNIKKPSSYEVEECYKTECERLQELIEKTNTYESTHLSNDFTNLSELICALKAFILEYLAKDNSYAKGYQSGSVTSSSAFQMLSSVVVTTQRDRNELFDELQTASKNETERMKVLQKEWSDERAKQGAIKWVIAVGAVVVGTLAIVCTAGAATPLVIAGAVAGAGSIAYGASNMYEANQDINYGLAGDPFTKAWNPLRDTIFMGNQTTYDTWGNANTFVAGFMIPVGTGFQAAKAAGSSIPRAIGVELVKDSISFGSGYVAGQLGTKYGTEYFGPEAGRWIGTASSLVAGFGTGMGLNRIDKVFNINGANIPLVLSARFLNKNDILYKNSEKIEAIDGYEDIIIHGDKIGFVYKDADGIESNLSIKDFAEILKNSPVYKGGPIRLISCETGASDAITAQYLANYLDVEVMAPTDIVYVYSDGKMIIGRSNSGTWEIFKPKE